MGTQDACSLLFNSTSGLEEQLTSWRDFYSIEFGIDCDIRLPDNAAPNSMLLVVHPSLTIKKLTSYLQGRQIELHPCHTTISAKAFWKIGPRHAVKWFVGDAGCKSGRAMSVIERIVLELKYHFDVYRTMAHEDRKAEGDIHLPMTLIRKSGQDYIVIAMRGDGKLVISRHPR